MASLPGSLKPIQHYLKTANEHDQRDPVVAYYCRMYAVQKGIKLDSSSKEAKTFLFSLMDKLEKVKADSQEEAISSEVVGQAHLENYALKLFLYADNEDRAGKFGKNVVKSFYTSGMLMDVLTTFGELPDEVENNRKYAKWKAAYIHKCLKAGETPIAGPLPDENEEEDQAAGGLGPSIGFDNVASVPPSTMTISQDSSWLPASGAHAPPTTPQDPMRGDYHQPQAPAGYNPGPSRITQPVQPSVPAQPSSAASNYATWVPPPNPSGYTLTSADYQKGTKLCKYAISAMQYEDSATAIENLTKALRLLTTGKET